MAAEVLMTAPTIHFPGAQPLTDVKVLLLEDNVDVRDSLKLLLESCGAEVSTAGTSREALSTLQKVHPDVVVSDIGLPDENGIAFIRRVRALPPGAGGDVPAIALSAYSEFIRESLAAGFQAGLRKPADPGNLMRLIGQIVHRTDPH
jgi:CheY-like chemotaxis protein